MMHAPPYSPLAGAGERQLPHYTPILWQGEVKPFDTLTHRKSSEGTSEASHDDELVAPTSIFNIAEESTRRATARFPLIAARTFPTYNYDPWSAIRRSQAFEPPKYTSASGPLPPPEYDAIDTQAQTFRLQAPFIYASKTSNLPQYQLAQDLGQNGKPSSLKMRRLRPSEMRSCSVPAIHVARVPKIQYDDAETMYHTSAVEMRGRGSSDIDGSIQVTSGCTLWGGTWTKIWHVSKPGRRDSWNSETNFDQWNRSRPGPGRASYDGDRILLYSIRKGVWEDGDGTIVAREEKSRIGRLDRILEITEPWARDKERRDLVVACWILRIWSGEGIRWEGM
ncbi:hypothetical protein EK21DRAFT_112553 [Setomelanomma holmii]|uniref:Uncharacterized protein n=1 Tax=Setomelanomma holmii TaxID=210430 RepID=A0A9P4H846_9PLEO|nr:hypothetical protein EK21DRAFT_112553 [Setomelanomma holmii]